MQIVSNDYKNVLNTNLSLSPKSKIVVGGVEYLGDVIKTFPQISHSNKSFIGGFPAKICSFEIYNLNNNLNFENKEITIYKGLVVNGSTEWIKQGIFIPRAKDITNDITTKTLKVSNAQDRTQLLDDKYESSLDWTNNQTHTGLEIVQEICTKKSITLETTNFAWANYLFKQPNFNETTTYREVISRLAEIGGEVALFTSNGGLAIKGQNTTEDTIKRSRYEDLSKENKYEVNAVVLGKEGIDDDVLYTPIKVYGKSKQETRNGKNKLKNVMVTQTLNGVTFIVNNDKSITINGTATERTEPKIWTNENDELTLISGTTYYNYTGTTLYFYSSSGYFLIENNKSYTPDSDVTINYAYIRVESGETIDKTIYPMLTTSTNNTYEQYGVSPSLEYPSEIISIPSIENLFDKDNVNILNAIVDTTNITAHNNAKSFYIECKPNTTYTISREIIGSRFVVGTTNNVPAVGEIVIDRIVNNSGSSITLTTSSNANYLCVYYLYNATENEQEILKNIMIEKGSIAHPWRPYGNHLRIDNMGENLYNYKDITTISNYITIDDDGWITASYDNTEGTGTVYPRFYTDVSSKLINDQYNLITEIKEVIGTGTLQVATTSGNGQLLGNGRYSFNELQNGDIKQVVVNNAGITNTGELLQTLCSFSKGQSGTITFRISVLEDTSITPDIFKYEPYSCNTIYVNMQDKKLCSIGDTKDEYDVITGKGIKRIGEIIFDGSESFSSYTDNNNITFFYTNDEIINSIDYSECLSNYFTCAKSYYEMTSRNGMIAIRSNGKRFYFTSNTSSVADFKNWLQEQYNAGTPLKVQYKLATPEEFTLEPTEMKFHDGINNINFSDELIDNIQIDLKEHRIDDNPFVDLYREEMISLVSDYIVGKSYIPFKLSGFVDGFIYELNDVLSIVDKDGNIFNAVMLDYSTSSRIKSTIKAETLDKTITTNYNLAGSKKSAINQVKLEVNHINNTISALSNKIEDLTDYLKTITGTNTIVLNNTAKSNGAIGKLVMTGFTEMSLNPDMIYPSEKVYPGKLTTYIIVQTNGTETHETYIDLGMSLNSTDELIIENNKVYVKSGSEITDMNMSVILRTFDGTTTISIKYFNNINFACDYIVKNDFTNLFAMEAEVSAQFNITNENINSKVSKAEVVSEINQSAEEVKIDASKISLNGYISNDEGNFEITQEGKAKFKDVSITGGNINLSSGGKVIGGDGILTNLQYSTLGRYGGYDDLGFTALYVNSGETITLECRYKDLSLDVYIPQNFKIIEAKVMLFHTPADWWLGDVEIWGYCRNIKLYKSDNSQNYTFRMGHYSEYELELETSYMEEIKNAFGTNGYTAKNTSGSSIETTTSIDIKDYLTKGNNKLVVRTALTNPTTEESMYQLCGMARAVINIIGYMSM